MICLRALKYVQIGTNTLDQSDRALKSTKIRELESYVNYSEGGNEVLTFNGFGMWTLEMVNNFLEYHITCRFIN